MDSFINYFINIHTNRIDGLLKSEKLMTIHNANYDNFFYLCKGCCIYESKLGLLFFADGNCVIWLKALEKKLGSGP